MKIHDLLKHLNIDEGAVGEFKDEDKIREIFVLFSKAVYYDTTKNIFNVKLNYEPDEVYDILKAGFGLHCQEQIFVLKEIYKFFGIKCVIRHGDIYDFDASARKELLTSTLVIDFGEHFFHIDPTHKTIIKAKKQDITQEGNIILEDLYDGFYLLKKYDKDDIYYIEQIFEGIPENIRRERLYQKYSELPIIPFGVTAPFYWTVNPERKIFYNVLRDKIRINIGRQIFYLDLFGWDMCEESSWLTRKQKDRICKSILKITDNVDDYIDMINNSKKKDMGARLQEKDIQAIKSDFFKSQKHIGLDI